MRSARSALLVCALLSSARGSVVPTVEVEILPGGDGDISSAELARRLRQVVASEVPGATGQFVKESRLLVHLTEEELAAKVARLQNYKHLIKLGAVNDPSVVRAALLTAGGNVPRAAIDLRKAAEARHGETPAILAQEATCLNHCPRPRKGNAWEHVQSRDCFLQCYTGATIPPTTGGADGLELDLEMDWETAGEILTAVDGETSLFRAKVTTTFPAQLDVDSLRWFIGACAALLVTVAWVINAAAWRPTLPSVVGDLERLVALKTSSELTDDEFVAAKRALLLLRSEAIAKESMETSCPTERRSKLSGELHPRIQMMKSWPLGAAEVAITTAVRVL